MARWGDLAKWVGPTVNQGSAMSSHKGVVIHIAAGYYDGTIAWQRNPSADVSSHFIVAKDGRIAQMVDTTNRSWAQRDGNSDWLSIENEGFLPHPLTAEQVEANARILARAHREYGVPLVVTNSPAKRGLGHHSMGAETGANWGHSECPGPAIKAQKPAIVARAIQIVNGVTPAKEPDVELDDKIDPDGKAGWPQRQVDDHFVDMQNVRGYLVGDPGVPKEAQPKADAPIRSLEEIPALVALVHDIGGKVDALTQVPPGSVIVGDEQLERVLRRVIGSVDGASPAT